MGEFWRPAPWSQLAGWDGQAFNTLTTPVLTTGGYYQQGGGWRSSAPAVSASPQELAPSFSAPLGLLSAPPCSPPWRCSSTTTATTSPSSLPARESAATTSTTTRCRRWNCSARCSSPPSLLLTSSSSSLVFFSLQASLAQGICSCCPGWCSLLEGSLFKSPSSSPL